MFLIRLWSEPASFEPIDFTPGLNIILSHVSDQERKAGSGSRNGAGKTTFARIVDFCLLDPGYAGSVLTDPVFKPYTFFLQFEHGGETYTIARSTQTPRSASLAVDDGVFRVSTIGELREKLAMTLFGLAPGSGPLNFTTLMSYLIRHENEGFTDIFRPTSLTKPTWHAALLFFLGLDYRLPIRLAELSKRKDEALTTKNALQTHLAAKDRLQPIEVALELQDAQINLERRQQLLANYRVGEEYQHLANQAAVLAKTIKRLANEKYVAQKRISDYRDLLDKPLTAAADVDTALQVFRDLQLVMPDEVKRTLHEVLQFQQTLVENRRRFLEQEIQALRERISDNEQEIAEVDERRRHILSDLRSNGGLGGYDDATASLTALRERIAQLKAQGALFADVDRQSQKIAELEAKYSHLSVEVGVHVLNSQDTVRAVARTFASLYHRLYGHAATFSVKMDKDLVFELRGLGHELESSGRYRTAVFCLDMALLMHNRDRSPFAHWLLHDGVFNGVDSTKVAAALQIAAELPDDLQYICTVNSDTIPNSADFRRFVRREIADSPAIRTFMRESF